MNVATGAAHLVSLLWETSWQGGVLAGLVWIGCRVVRVSPRIASLLWWCVLLKFLLGLIVPGLFGNIGLRISIPLISPSVAAEAAGSQAIPNALFVGTAIAWLLGVVVCLALLAYRAQSASRSAQEYSRTFAPDADRAISEMVREIGRQLHLSERAVPTVRISDSAEGPQITGAFHRPVVLLPAALVAPSPSALTSDELRLILAHEMAHLKRGDLWTGLVPALAECLFFFHPLVRLARREWEASREEACDALALSALSGEPAATQMYGTLLLRLGSGAPPQERPSVMALRMVPSPYRALHRRLSHLDRWRVESLSPSGLFTPGAIGALGVAGLLLVPLRPEFTAPVDRPAVAQEVPASEGQSAPRHFAVGIRGRRQSSHFAAAIPVMRTTPRRMHAELPQFVPVHREAGERPVFASTGTVVAQPKPVSMVTKIAPALPKPVTAPNIVLSNMQQVSSSPELHPALKTPVAILSEVQPAPAHPVNVPVVPSRAASIAQPSYPQEAPTAVASSSMSDSAPDSTGDSTTVARSTADSMGIIHAIHLPNAAVIDVKPTSRVAPPGIDVRFPSPLIVPTPSPQTPIPVKADPRTANP